MSCKTPVVVVPNVQMEVVLIETLSCMHFVLIVFAMISLMTLLEDGSTILEVLLRVPNILVFSLRFRHFECCLLQVDNVIYISDFLN